MITYFLQAQGCSQLMVALSCPGAVQVGVFETVLATVQEQQRQQQLVLISMAAPSFLVQLQLQLEECSLLLHVVLALQERRGAGCPDAQRATSQSLHGDRHEQI